MLQVINQLQKMEKGKRSSFFLPCPPFSLFFLPFNAVTLYFCGRRYVFQAQGLLHSSACKIPLYLTPKEELTT